jgi:hypothetical protein
VEEALRLAAEGFGLDISGAVATSYGDGLIHTTWRLDTACGPHLLQRLNATVFTDPTAVAENAAAAAARVDDALHRAGDHDPRHRLVYLAGPAGHPWLRDTTGAVWRATPLVADSRPAGATCQDEVCAAARALGRFPGLVAAGTGPALIEVLPGFHDTPARLAVLQEAVEADSCGRLAVCRDEAERLLDLAPLAHRLGRDNQPTRLVHNDAKLENVLVDTDTGEALCVIDLDTVMPGLATHDFGDLVRSAVSERPEDEPDLHRIAVSEPTFRDLATGYLSGAADWIVEGERARLVDGALAITFEQAVRFLTDFLAGDTYYPVADHRHNLRRAHAQLRLLEELLAVEEDLRDIVAGSVTSLE